MERTYGKAAQRAVLCTWGPRWRKHVALFLATEVGAYSGLVWWFDEPDDAVKAVETALILGLAFVVAYGGWWLLAFAPRAMALWRCHRAALQTYKLMAYAISLRQTLLTFARADDPNDEAREAREAALRSVYDVQVRQFEMARQQCDLAGAIYQQSDRQMYLSPEAEGTDIGTRLHNLEGWTILAARAINAEYAKLAADDWTPPFTWRDEARNLKDWAAARYLRLRGRR